MGSWDRLVFVSRMETKLQGSTGKWDSLKFFSFMGAVSL